MVNLLTANVKLDVSRHRDKLQRYEFLWGLLRMAESGVEASGQMVLQIWILTFYLGSLADLSLRQLLEKTLKGVVFFLYEPSALERSMGKLFISLVSIHLGMVHSYRLIKRGSLDSDHCMFYSLSLLFQLASR